MRKLIFLALPVLAITACESATGPQTTDPAVALPSASVSDAANQGADGLYFLPPMVSNPAHGGTFDGALSPVVEICATPACESIHASFSTTEGHGSEVVRMAADDEHYIVNWHASATGAVAGQTYRVRVLVNEMVLGYADVTVVSTGREAVTVRSDGSIALVATQTLPVKFRIEMGTVGAVVVTPAEATIDVGESQQFTAALFDLHGEPLAGPVITWSGGDTDVATVSATGLATGVADGSVAITASAGAVNGSAILVVSAVSAAQTIVIPGTWSIDLESGDLGNASSDVRMDLFWRQQTLSERYLDPRNGAMVANLGAIDFDALTPDDLVALTYTTVPINGSNVGNEMPAGTVIAVRTAEGNYAKLQVLELDTETRRLTITWVIYAGSGTAPSWHAMGAGMNGVVSDLTVFNGDLIAGGGFTTADGNEANYIARWDGSAWQPLGTGMGGSVTHVRALTVYGDDLIAGGRFTTAGGQEANMIARWDGSAWHSMGAFGSTVETLTVHEGNLIAGGAFTTADGQTVNRVARWDGSAWQPMGVGMNEWVYVLLSHKGDLIAGGQFTEAGGQTANRIARWDGSAWQPMRGGANSHVRDLAIDENGDLIVGGPFTAVDGKTSLRIARWDGLDWHTATGTNNQVNAFTWDNGDLIAGGVFTAAGGQPANRIARLDGSAWQSMGTGMDNNIWALTIYQGDVIAGGTFTLADGQVANRIARWGTP